MKKAYYSLMKCSRSSIDYKQLFVGAYEYERLRNQKIT